MLSAKAAKYLRDYVPPQITTMKTVYSTLQRRWRVTNKCIGDDTKAAARQSLNSIIHKKNKIWRKTIFNIGGWNSYTLRCGTIMTLISPGDCTLQCGMWLWNCDSEFTTWQHPAMWYVALGWHATEFAQTSAILEFYIWFRFRPITAVDMSFCTSLRNFIQIGSPSAEKNDVM